MTRNSASATAASGILVVAKFDKCNLTKLELSEFHPILYLNF